MRKLLHIFIYSPGQNTGEGRLSLLQGIFPTQESNQDLWHCRRILYQLNYQGSPIYLPLKDVSHFLCRSKFPFEVTSSIWRIFLGVQIFSVVQSLSHVWLFATPRTAACQASLSFMISQHLLKFMSIQLVMLFNNLILCLPLVLLPSILPTIRVFSNESALHTSGSQSIRALASVLSMNI